MSWLIDTNVLSELRKGSRADNRVRAWFDTAAEAELFTSVLVLGEIRRGVELIRRRDSTAAETLERWMKLLPDHFAGVRRQFIRPMIPLLALRVWMETGRLNAIQPDQSSYSDSSSSA